MKKLFVKLMVPIISLILVLLYYTGTTMIIDKTRTFLFVKPVSFIVVALSLIVIFVEIKGYLKETKQVKGTNNNGNSDIFTKNKIILVMAAFFYLFLSQTVGIKISTIFISFIMLFFFGVKRKSVLIGVPILLLLIVYVLFEIILNVPFPSGILG